MMRRVDEKTQCQQKGAMPTVATEILGKAKDVTSRNIKHAELMEKVSPAPSIST